MTSLGSRRKARRSTESSKRDDFSWW